MRTIDQIHKPPELLTKFPETDKKTKLKNLLENNLDFHDEESGYVSQVSILSLQNSRLSFLEFLLII